MVVGVNSVVVVKRFCDFVDGAVKVIKSSLLKITIKRSLMKITILIAKKHYSYYCD